MAEDEKPRLVRIKRKRCDEPVDVLWLEQSPSKRHDTDVAKLRLDDQTSSAGRSLFRRLQTVPVSQVGDASLSHSLMSELSRKSDKQAERRSGFKKLKKPGSSGNKEQHEKIAHTARYKQVWRNRLGSEDEDAMHQFFQLYDVERAEEQERQKDNELLMKYMPLLRELSPERFGGGNDQASATSTDDFVYDVYAEDEERESDDDEDLITLQVSERLDYRAQEVVDSDYDSEDSNREDHPDHDYPDEDDDDDSEVEDEDDEEGQEDESDDEEDRRWRMRR